MNTKAINLGDKVAQTKISKKDKSRNRREKRIQLFAANPKFANKNHCGECGYCIRGENHLTGSHHLSVN